MSGNLLLACACAIVFVAGIWVTRHSRAADHHPLHEDFYRTWMRNDGLGSCCNARIDHPNGGQTGDCEPTDARLVAGRWYARLPHAGPFIEVPEARIIRQINPSRDGADGHLCWSPSQGVICFVPPAGTL